MSQDQYSQYIEIVAELLLGKPDKTKPTEWRYGTHGSLSVDVQAGTWYDHERQEGGGVLALIMRETAATSKREAVQWLEAKSIKPTEPEKPRSAAKAKRARIAATYDYVDADGVLQYQVVRMEPKDFRQRKPSAESPDGWDWSVKGATPLPYRLPDIANNPRATVIIVEGEKDADALASMDLVATCNSGGAGKWQPELTPHLSGRRVVIIPDNDDAGRKHSQLVASALFSVAQSVRILTIPELPPKGDVSDWLSVGGTREQLIEMCRTAPTWEPETLTISVPDSAPPLPDEPEPPSQHTGPFRPLGYSSGSYYYMPRGTEQVAEIRRGAHTAVAEMLSLAPIEWWEMSYPTEKGATDWHLAASECMRMCERAGIYSVERERGRGAWYDRGRSVLHLGDRLIVDGSEARISDHASHYIYTRQAPMESGVAAVPATDSQANAVLDIFDQLSWSKPVHGMLAAGWCALAPICGALSWRPHVWLTAQRGAGKSWAQEHVFKPLLGPSAMMVQGSTTEAGLRQRLRQDARPIVFDEAESEEQNSQRRVQLIVELARQASSDGGAEIVKGTSSGSGMAFRIRSMFMLSSINVALTQAADESRFSVLSLATPKRTPAEIARFSAFEQMVHRVLSDELCAAIRARSYRLVPTIRVNAKTLSRAVAERLGSQRIGDQVGTLLAGYYSLLSGGEISLDDARVMCDGIDFTDAKEAEAVSDEESCISRIMQAQVRFDTTHGTMQRSIAEIVRCAAGVAGMDAVMQTEANAVLGRFGMMVDGGFLAVSNNHAELQNILKQTAWGAGWKRVIARIPGAHASPEAIRFAGSRSRATMVPLEFIG